MTKSCEKTLGRRVSPSAWEKPDILPYDPQRRRSRKLAARDPSAGWKGNRFVTPRELYQAGLEPTPMPLRTPLERATVFFLGWRQAWRSASTKWNNFDWTVAQNVGRRPSFSSCESSASETIPVASKTLVQVRSGTLFLRQKAQKHQDKGYTHPSGR